jgi:hypothetical protein
MAREKQRAAAKRNVRKAQASTKMGKAELRRAVTRAKG